MTLVFGGSLIGRDRELQHLGDLLGAVSGGSAVAVLIEGEAGIGKTRLLASLSDLAVERGMTVFRGAAHPLERTRPFGPLVDALDLVPDSPDARRAGIGRLLMADDAVRAGMPVAGQLLFRAVEEIIDLLEVLSDERSLLLELDDLHWADGSTLTAVLWALRRLTEVPLLLVGALRPTPRDRDLAQLVEEAMRLGVTLIRLAPLDDDDVMALVHAELGMAPGPALAKAVRGAGGNPLWVVELLRSLSAEKLLDLTGDEVGLSRSELPDSIRQLVLGRLGELPEKTVSALRIASVLGEEFSLRDLATVTGRRVTDLVEELAEAFRAGLIADHRGKLIFRHQLVRDAVYEDIPEAARIALHREAAGLLAEGGAPLAQVASHLVLGAVSPDVDAAVSLRTAAREAAPRAPWVAAQMLRRAHELLPVGHPQRDGISAELSETLIRMGQVPEAVEIAEEVLARPHDPEIDMQLRLVLIEALSVLFRADDLIEQTEMALSESPDMPAAVQAFVLSQGSFGRTFSGDPVEGEASARRALALAERAGDPAMITWSLTTLSIAMQLQGRFGEAVQATDRAVSEALAAPDEQARLRGPFFLHGMSLRGADRLDDAVVAYRKAAAECDELESWWLLPDIQLMSTEVRLLRGDWEGVSAELEGGVQFAREHGNLITLPQFHAYMALVASARGDVTAGELSLLPFVSMLDDEQPRFGTELIVYAAAMLKEVAGQPTEALELLRRFWQRAAVRAMRFGHRFIAPALVRLALSLDAPDAALDATEGAERTAALAGDVPSVQSAALRCRGLIDGDPEKLLAAVALARSSTRRLDLAGSCEDAAGVLAAAGNRSEGRALLVEALDIYESIGASWWTSRANARLREMGGRRGSRGSRQRALTGWDSLTTSERAVVELVAEGLTNREVGKRLFISPHTVSSHLRHAFQKLDVSTRAALATKVTRAKSDG